MLDVVDSIHKIPNSECYSSKFPSSNILLRRKLDVCFVEEDDKLVVFCYDHGLVQKYRQHFNVFNIK